MLTEQGLICKLTTELYDLKYKLYSIDKIAEKMYAITQSEKEDALWRLARLKFEAIQLCNLVSCPDDFEGIN